LRLCLALISKRVAIVIHEKRCPDCDLLMDEGYIVDFADYNAAAASKWAPGKPQWGKLLGFVLGAIKVNKSELMETTTFRCPKCGLLKSYAMGKQQK